MIESSEEPARAAEFIANALQLTELLNSGAPLAQVLEAFVKRFELAFAPTMCAVMLLDADGMHLRHAAAGRLPAAYCRAIDGVALDLAVDAASAAMLAQQTVMVADLGLDPRCCEQRELALRYALHACCSMPLVGARGQLLGTLALYDTTLRQPSPAERLGLQCSAKLLGLFIEQSRMAGDLAVQRQALLDSDARYRTLLEWSPEAVAIHRAGVLIYVNTATLRLLRANHLEDLLGRSIAELLHPDYREIGLARAKLVFEENIEAPLIQEILLRLDGTPVEVEIQSKAIVYDGAKAVYVVAHDVSQRRQDEVTIYQLAFYDSLTGLANRRLLLDRLQQALLMSGRKQEYGALLLLDLDHFKRVNDLLGHKLGDALLRQVAQRLLGCVRKSDSVARVGGDEFMVLLETFAKSTSDAAQYAETIASKVLTCLTQPYNLADKAFCGSVSIGIVVFMEGEATPDEVAQKADTAMYQAKAAGRNKACFFDAQMQAQALTRVAFGQDMQSGFDKNEFALYYQLQVDAQGQPIGAEALARWHSARRGMVPPLEFIPLAEENGLILPLGQFVLESACAQLVQWEQAPHTANLSISVNVSARQFAQDDFVSHVAAALERTGANPKRLKLELTESMLVTNVDSVIAKMKQVQAFGVRFSLDDFGTGYSSLSYLKLLPMAQLKIDQSFVRDLLTDPNDAVIARIIVALGHSLGISVIAEGVETSEQLALLCDMGCDALQGYYFGRPVPAQAFAAALLADLSLGP